MEMVSLQEVVERDWSVPAKSTMGASLLEMVDEVKSEVDLSVVDAKAVDEELSMIISYSGDVYGLRFFEIMIDEGV